MTRSDEHRIADILDAARKLAERLDIPFESWVEDEDLRLITERLIEIIGEAARAMSPEGRATWPDVDWTGLIGLRTVLVHAYHRVQPDLLWRAATVDIPAIAAELAGSSSISSSGTGSIPDSDVAAAQAYCADRIPPQYRDEIRVECTQRANNLTIHECRPPWNPDHGPEWTRQPVAQLRYDSSDQTWTLYCADRNGRWHRYPDVPQSDRIDSLLHEITEDPTGIFWG